VTLHWYLAPLPGTEKAMYGLLFSRRLCCQKPDVRFHVKNIANLDLPTSSKHSLTSLTQYGSRRLLRLTALKLSTLLVVVSDLQVLHLEVAFSPRRTLLSCTVSG
jgi:hypothetical protein